MRTLVLQAPLTVEVAVWRCTRGLFCPPSYGVHLSRRRNSIFPSRRPGIFPWPRSMSSHKTLTFFRNHMGAGPNRGLLDLRCQATAWPWWPVWPSMVQGEATSNLPYYVLGYQVIKSWTGMRRGLIPFSNNEKVVWQVGKAVGKVGVQVSDRLWSRRETWVVFIIILRLP